MPLKLAPAGNTPAPAPVTMLSPMMAAAWLPCLGNATAMLRPTRVVRTAERNRLVTSFLLSTSRPEPRRLGVRRNQGPAAGAEADLDLRGANGHARRRRARGPAR